MPYDVKKMMFTTICQKCNAQPTKTPLIDFLLPNGLLWVPDFLYCPGCGNYVTIQTREMSKVELKERDEGAAKKLEAAIQEALDEVKIVDEFTKVDDNAVAAAKDRITDAETEKEN